MNKFIEQININRGTYELYLEYSSECLANNKPLICYANFEKRIKIERKKQFPLSIEENTLLDLKASLEAIGRA